MRFFLGVLAEAGVVSQEVVHFKVLVSAEKTTFEIADSGLDRGKEDELLRVQANPSSCAPSGKGGSLIRVNPRHRALSAAVYRQ